MAKYGDRLSFRDAVRAAEDGHEEELLLSDQEYLDGSLDQEEFCTSDSLPVYMTIHK